MDINRVFENGVGFYTCENPNMNSFCLSVWVRRGSVHEPRENHGLAHMLEHAIFRNIQTMMKGNLYAELSRLALSFDACTYYDHVTFEISGPSGHFDAAADILMMIFQPLNLSVSALDMERKRVKAEILEGDDENSFDSRVLREIWKDKPMARTIIGTESSVNLIGFEALDKEYKRWFSVGNFFFCGAGNMPGLKKLGERIAMLQPGKDAPPEKGMMDIPEDFFHRDGKIVIELKDYTYLRFAFDVDTSRYTEPECMILRSWLFGTDGPFYMKLSEETGVTYTINSSLDRFANVGSFYFEYETDIKLLTRSMEIVVQILNETKNVPDEIIETVCRACAFDADFVRDNCADYCYIWGHDNGYKNMGFQSHEARKAAYISVKPERIRKMAKEIFRSDNLTLYVCSSKRKNDEKILREIIMQLESDEVSS